MDALITNIRQDAGFYCSKAMKAFEQKDYFESIKYLNKAEKVAIGGERHEIYFILGLIYGSINDYQKSTEYFLLSLFSIPLQSKAFKAIFDNAVLTEDFEMAKFFMDRQKFCPGVTEKETEEIKKAYDFFIKKAKPKIREVKIEDSKKYQKDYEDALKAFIDNQCDISIDILSRYDYKNSPKTRELLADSYIVVNEIDKAKEVLHSAERLSITDKICLISVEYLQENDGKVKQLIEDIQKQQLTLDETLKFAEILTKVNEGVLAVKILEDCLKKEPYDIYLAEFYCVTCIDLGLFSKAKNKLMQLKEIKQSESAFYMEMLNICEAKTNKKIYDIHLFYKSFEKKWKAKLKTIAKLEGKDFDKAIMQNEALLYWLAKSDDKHLRNTIFVRVAKIRSALALLQKIFADYDIDVNLKYIIAKVRFEMGYNEETIVAVDNKFLAVCRLAEKHRKNPLYYKAYIMCVGKLFDDNKERGYINFNNIFDRIGEFCNDSCQNPYVLAAIISWVAEYGWGGNIKKICHYYGIEETEFWKYYIEEI